MEFEKAAKFLNQMIEDDSFEYMAEIAIYAVIDEAYELQTELKKVKDELESIHYNASMNGVDI